MIERDGHVIGHNALVTDPNGNTLTFVAAQGQYIDSTGQLALTSVMGAYGPPRVPDTYTYQDANGANQTVSVNYSAYTQQTAWGCGGDIAPTSVSFPSSVSWPDGTSLSLTYEHGAGTNTGTITGRIASLTLPTGGTISYAYSGGSNGINCADGSPATLTRTENGQTTTYVHTTINANYQASTVETLADGGTETFLFSGPVYGGNVATTLYSDVVADSSGSVISTKLINFNGNPNGSQSGSPPPRKLTLTSIEEEPLLRLVRPDQHSEIRPRLPYPDGGKARIQEKLWAGRDRNSCVSAKVLHAQSDN